MHEKTGRLSLAKLSAKKLCWFLEPEPGWKTKLTEKVQHNYFTVVGWPSKKDAETYWITAD